MKKSLFTAVAIVFATGYLAAQDPGATDKPVASSSSTPAPSATTMPAVEEAEEDEWGIGISAFQYFEPDARDYVQPTVTFDRGWFHFEGRYNYEDYDTGSVWLGYNFEWSTDMGEDQELSLEATPMFGGVFGDITGVAPGLKATLSYWKCQLYTECEYVLDTEESTDSFFYHWTEFSVAPVEWFRFGAVTQDETDGPIQWGALVGASYKCVNLDAYIFNPFDDRPRVVLGLGVSF